MRAVLTRVTSASVEVEGRITGKIGRGFLILLGVGPEDTEKECEKLCKKLLSLRIFTDENDKMNLSLEAVDGQVLVVSQFTLYGSCKKGRRISSARRIQQRPRRCMSISSAAVRRTATRRSTGSSART